MENKLKPYHIVTFLGTGLIATGLSWWACADYHDGKPLGKSVVKTVKTVSAITTHVSKALEECQAPSITNSTDK